MLFWKSWFNRKVLFVQGILNAIGSFLTLEKLQSKFKIQNKFSSVFSIDGRNSIGFEKESPDDRNTGATKYNDGAGYSNGSG